MPTLGFWEIMLIFLAVLIIFGPKRLPEMGKSLGRAIKEFKKAGKEIQEDITEALDEEEQKPQAPKSHPS